jgi:hypothetical protein
MLDKATKQNINFFYYYATDTKKKIDTNTKNLTNIKKIKISERYNLFLTPSSDTN